MEKQMNTRHMPTPEPERRWDWEHIWRSPDGDDWRVLLDLKQVNGRIAPVAILIQAVNGKTALTHLTLVDLPLRQIAREAAEAETEFLQSRIGRKAAPHGGRPYTDEELQHVANLYMTAWERQIPVQRSVADALDISLSTAAKRIMAARKRGLIPNDLRKGKTND